jgi:hypothetical protein
VWDTLCDVLVEQCGTDKPLAAPFFIILVVVAAVLVLTAGKLHAALLLPGMTVRPGRRSCTTRFYDGKNKEFPTQPQTPDKN